MKLAIVIHRYGDGVAGGSEAHARGLAEALRGTHDVEVLTTTARDYLSWKNEFPVGTSDVGGIRVTRYPVQKTRDLARFAAVSDHVFNEEHTREDEERWIVENGPLAPDLMAAVRARTDIDFFLCYSYRYYTGIKGALAAGRRAILVPTAEEDEAIRLAVRTTASEISSPPTHTRNRSLVGQRHRRPAQLGHQYFAAQPQPK